MSRKRLAILILFIPSTLLVTLLAACQPRSAAPSALENLVATGMAGTAQAKTLSAIVAATYAAVPTRTPPPTAPAAAQQPSATPGPCAPGDSGQLAYVDPAAGYCFLYPASFQANESAGEVTFQGPSLGSGSSSLRATIRLFRLEPVDNRTLDEIAADLWRGSRGPYRLSNIVLGGRDALVAQNLILGETEMKSKELFFIHHDYIYIISFTPADTAAPYSAALPDIQKFWDAAIPSFTFTN